jgi:glycosyltransferase involved in cell wall biosynthesis
MQEVKPFISIVVPTRNRVDWLRRCLDGISEQDYPDYEVLVIDDGSTEDVVTAYELMMNEFGSRYQLIRANKQEGRRLGPSVIRNIGIDKASGCYIAFCDDDDYWCQPDLLSIAANCLKATNLNLFFSDQKILHDDEVVSNTSFKHVKETLTENQKLPDKPVYNITRKQMLSFPDYAHLNITIAKKTLLESIGGFWEETRYAEDVDLFVRLCAATDSILFRPDVCSAHNAPVKHDRESASKIVGDVNRRLLESSVYWHLLATCKTTEAVDYAALSLASNTKLLTQELLNKGSNKAAASVARMAFGVRPTLKWGLYTFVLSIKALFLKS